MKKETPPPEDYSSWGQESATIVDQENICEFFFSLYLLRSINSLTTVDLLLSKGNRLLPQKSQRKEKAVPKPRAPLLKEALNHHRLKFGTSQPQQRSLLRLLMMVFLFVMYLLIRAIDMQKRKMIRTAMIYMSHFPV